MAESRVKDSPSPRIQQKASDADAETERCQPSSISHNSYFCFSMLRQVNEAWRSVLHCRSSTSSEASASSVRYSEQSILDLVGCCCARVLGLRIAAQPIDLWTIFGEEIGSCSLPVFGS